MISRELTGLGSIKILKGEKISRDKHEQQAATDVLCSLPCSSM